VTKAAGFGTSAPTLYENHYNDYLMLHGLGVEMAEALAELWHQRIAKKLGYAQEDGPR